MTKGIYGRYISWLFWTRFGTISGGCLSLIVLFDMGELYRRQGPQFSWISALVKVPFLYHTFLPLFLVSTCIFLGLHFMRTYEWIALRTAGMRFSRIFFPLGLWCIALSFLDFTLLHPLSLRLIHDHRPAQPSTHHQKWVEYKTGSQQNILTYIPTQEHSMALGILYKISSSYDQLGYVYGRYLSHENGLLTAHEGWSLHKGHFQPFETYPIASTLPPWIWKKHDPKTMSFWQLEKYLRFFSRQFGSSPSSYILQWHSLLARWILMVVVSALAFRFWEIEPRSQPIARLLSLTFGLSWGLFFLKDLSISIALAYHVSSGIGVWTGLITALGLGTFFVARQK